MGWYFSVVVPFHCAQRKLMQLFCDTARARERLWVCPFGFGDYFSSPDKMLSSLSLSPSRYSHTESVGWGRCQVQGSYPRAHRKSMAEQEINPLPKWPDFSLFFKLRAQAKCQAL